MFWQRALRRRLLAMLSAAPTAPRASSEKIAVATIIPPAAARRVMDACWNVENLPNAAEIATLSVST